MSEGKEEKYWKNRKLVDAGYNIVYLHHVGRLEGGELIVKKKRYRRCVFRNGDREQCRRYDTRWDKDLWPLCHKHAIEIGYTEDEWKDFPKIRYEKEDKK